MNGKLRFAIGQINCTVGDFEGNAKKIKDCVEKAKRAGARIVAFPELAVAGYPPEDLLLKPRFIKANLESLDRISEGVDGIVAVVGFVDKKGADIYNAAAIIDGGKVKGIYRKIFLPNYGVFDEKRYFKAGDDPLVFRYGDISIGVNICEDIWHGDGPTRAQASSGAGFIININASPYYAGKTRERELVVKNQAKENKVVIAYINLVGGQDELVFDGQSMLIDDKGDIISHAKAFEEDLVVCDIDIPQNKANASRDAFTIAAKAPDEGAKEPIIKNGSKPLEETAEIYEALKLGLKDYVIKNGFQKAVIGLSGGIDSALVAALATDALGKENVSGVFMPSRYSSEQSAKDAQATAKNLGIGYMTIPIEDIFKAYLATLDPHFAGAPRNITEENLQARIRGTTLMALSNKFGWLVLTTGNKSEMSTGYATLYGDMAGGFAVIKDVPKTLVYKLAKYRNSIGKVIPEEVFTKEPTAELRPNQKDSDTLPPYDILDKIVKAYVEEDKDSDSIISSGINKETAYKVLAMVDRSEYKRRQSPPGIKITPKAFGKDRRMPITNLYKEY